MKKTTRLLFILVLFFCFHYHSQAQACQDFEIEMTSISSPINEDGYIYLCVGETLNIETAGIYNNNDIEYSQEDSTTDFVWFTHNQSSGSISSSISTSYNQVGIYPIVCQGIDVNNCESSNQITIYAIVSGPNSIDLSTSLPSGTYCPGDDLTLIANSTFDPLELISLDTVTFTYENDTPVFIPDSDGNIYVSSIDVPNYMDNPNIQLEHIIVCVDIEHSYLGDLEIILTCPDGSDIILQEYGTGGGGVYLGEPIDDEGLDPGIPYTYCWTPFAENGTLSQSSTSGGSSLPAGNYSPQESFDQLLDCPNEGNWIISFEDYLGIDNGFVFSWSLGLVISDSLLFEDVDFDTISYVPQMADQYWVLPDGTEVYDSEVDVAIADTTYTYHIVDDLGCEMSYDLVLEFEDEYTCLGCIPYPNSDVPIGFNICPGDSVVLWGNTFYDAGNYSIYPDTSIYCLELIDVIVSEYPTDYEISVIPTLEGEEEGSITITTNGYYIIDDNGDYITTMDSLASGTYVVDFISPVDCIISDTVFVGSYQLLFAQVEVSDGFTSSSTFSVEVFISGGWGDYTIEWSTGETDIVAIDGLGEGNHWVTVTDELGNEFTVNFYAGNSSSYDLSIFNSIDIHPNPANDLLHINAVFVNNYDYNFAIYDLLGKNILSKSGNGNDINTSENIEHIPTGVYLLRIMVDGNTWAEKIIIE